METVTMDDLVRLAVVVAGIWGFVKIVGEIVKAINARHDREQKWDETASNIRNEREEIVCQYNAQLAEIRNQQDDIKQKQESIRTEFDAKVQDIKAEQYIIVECLRAVLDGLHQQGCNGKVSEAIKILDDYLMEKAYK